MDENYWKDAYQNTWDDSSKRENWIKKHLEDAAGVKCSKFGLGAGSSEYISGSAERNGYQKGDADFMIEGTNVYIEVTGPLVRTVQQNAPLWFRPDKLNNAINNSGHDVFLVHHCMSANLWRVIHVDEEFKQRYCSGKFETVTPFIKGRRECYVAIEATDECIKGLDYLVNYLKSL